MGPTPTEMGLTEDDIADQDLEGKAKIVRTADVLCFTPTDFLQKQEVFLTLVGLKPVSMLGIPLENRDEFIKVITQLGLAYGSTEGNPGKSETFFISKDKSKINQYKAAIKTKGSLGLLLGYPESAVNAFGKVEVMDFEEQRKLVLEATGIDIQKAPFFRFSKTNYREELEVLAEWYKKLKEYHLDTAESV